MTPQQIVGLVARLFALWLVIIAFQIFTIASVMNQSQPEAASLYFTPVLPLLLALFLWRFPMFIAHKLVPRTHDTNTLRMPARELTAAASAIIGIWALISSLPHLFAFGAFILYGGVHQTFATYFSGRSLEILAIAFRCVFGLFLVVKPWFVASKVFPTEVVSNDAEQF